MSGVVFVVNFLGRLAAPAHRVAVEFEAIGVVDQAVEDGIGKGWFIDDVVPCSDRQLAGDQDRAVAVAVLDDFHQVAALAGGEAIRTPVVEDEQVRLDQGPEQAWKAAVAMGQFEVGEETG